MQTERHSEQEMHEIHYGSDFRLHDDYGISLPSVGQRLMFSVFSWAHCGSVGAFLQLLTVREWEPFSLFHHSMIYIFDYFPVVIHWISKEASAQAQHLFLV